MFCVQPETDHSTLINIMYSVGSLSNRIKNEGERMKKKKTKWKKYIYTKKKKSKKKNQKKTKNPQKTPKNPKSKQNKKQKHKTKQTYNNKNKTKTRTIYVRLWPVTKVCRFPLYMKRFMKIIQRVLLTVEHVLHFQ